MTWIGWLAIGFAALAIGMWPIVAHNRLVSMQATVVESWRGIDVELTRRWDLIPRLADVARTFAQHEAAVLDGVALRHRSTRLDETPAEALRELKDHVIADESRSEVELDGALTELRALAQAHPALQSSSHYSQLMTALRDTEDRIAAARRLYNGNVSRYNAQLKSFPTTLLNHHEPAQFWVMANDEHVSPPVMRLRD